MTPEDMADLFERHEGEFIKFDRVTTKRSNRRDLHAFIRLDELVPGDRCVISGAEHDEIWIEVSIPALAKVATEADIIELIRCGVRLDADVESLAMFA